MKRTRTVLGGTAAMWLLAASPASAATIESLSADIDVIWVAIKRTRKLEGVTANTPLRLVRRENGHVAIIEIWDEDLGAEYAASRWNGGNVARAPEPTSVMLLVAGLLGLLGSTLLRQKNR